MTLLEKQGAGPLSGLHALVVDHISSILDNEAHFVSFLKLIQLIYKIHDAPGELLCRDIFILFLVYFFVCKIHDVYKYICKVFD